MIRPFENPSCFLDAKLLRNKKNDRFIQHVLEEQKREEVIDQVFHKTSSANPYHEKVQNTIKLSSAVSDHKHAEFIAAKRRQQLRETNQDLKDLEVKLRAAYVSKSLEAQKADRKLLEVKEKARKLYEWEVLEKSRLNQADYLKEQEEMLQKKKQRFREGLQEQMAQLCVERGKKYEEFLQEKKAVELEIKKVQEEIHQKRQDELEKRRKTKEEMIRSVKAKELWKQQQQSDETTDFEHQLAVIKEQALVKQSQAEERMRIRKEKAAIAEEIGRRLEAAEQEKIARESLLADLLREERKYNDELKFREKLEKERKTQIEVQKALINQRNQNLMRKEKLKEEDRLYRELLLQEQAKKEKLEQLSKQDKHFKSLQYRDSILETLNEKKLIKAKELTLMLKQRQQQFNDEQEKEKLVEEERLRMLKEHATALKGFWPPGVLRPNEHDLLLYPKEEYLDSKAQGDRNP